MNIVRIIQFVDVYDFGWVAEGASPISLAGVIRIAVVSEMAAYRGAVIGFPLDDAVGGHPAARVPGDTVVVSFRKVSGIHELTLFHRREIASVCNDFL